MIYKTFALALIFALAFATEELVEPAKDGLLSKAYKKCKGAGCYVYDRLKKNAREVDSQHNEDLKQGETIKLVRDLVNKIKQLLSESQAPKACPATSEEAAAAFQTQLGQLTEKYLDPLMAKMDEAMEKLPTEVKTLFKEIMEAFKTKISELNKPMTQLTQEDLQKLLEDLKNKYEDKVKETMENANKRFDMEGAQDKESAEQKANLEKLQGLMKRFEGKSQGEAMGMVVDPEFVKDVEGVLGEDVVRDGLKKATEAIDDISRFTTAAQCAAKMGVFEEMPKEL